MLTFDDCLHFSELTEDEMIAIAEHEHVPDVVACELGRGLCASPGGCREILRYIADDIVHAETHHDLAKSMHLHQVLHHFAATHHYL